MTQSLTLPLSVNDEIVGISNCVKNNLEDVMVVSTRFQQYVVRSKKAGSKY